MALTDQRDHVWWIERDSVAIANYDSSENIDNRFSGPAGSKTITLFVTEYHADLGTTLSDSTSLPSEFHEALVFKAIQRGYEVKMAQDPDMAKNASYFEGGFEKSLKEGMKYANTDRVGGTPHVMGHDY